MSNYTKTTNFSTKDALPSGNPAKIVKGTEIDTEFNNIATAVATKSNSASPTFTGTLTAPVVTASTSLNIAGDGATVTGIKDEDDMASNSATKLATQQSIKAYVDSQVTAQDLDVTDGTTSISIDLDSEALSLLGGTGIDSTASGNSVTMAIDSTVATLTGTQTLSNKTLATPVISGNLTTDGTVDGRDVAADGAKLDGIEAGATADQTAAEIKTAYESNANTNAFTDADESKLDGIEAGADVTDTANVAGAGALMDSELTSITAVKALDQGVATTDSPTFAALTSTGEITANGGIALGDNDKATFGAGDDLQIYHDGSHSYVSDQGTGNIKILADDFILKNSADTETMIQAFTDAAVSLWYDNSAKLTTTSTGIDVTGTATMDGLVVDGDVVVASTVPRLILSETDVTNGNWDFRGSFGNLLIRSLNDDLSTAVSRLGIAAGGDISFYEDTGTTPKFFWDASAESLAIGTGATSAATINAYSKTVSANLPSALRVIENTGASSYWDIGSTGGASNNLNFYANANTTPKMTLSGAGNLGIGNTSPYSPLSVTTTGTLPQDKFWYDQVNMLTLNGTRPRAGLSTAATAGGNAYDGDMLFYNMYYDGGADYQWKERMRITSNGNVGIGDSSPSVKLDVYQSTAGIGTVDFRHVNGNRILINPSYNYHDAYNHIFRGLNGTSTHMTIDNLGNVGIGVSPTNVNGYKTLNVGAGSIGSIIKIDGANAGHYHRILNNNGQLFIQADQGNTTGSSAIVFGVDATERFRIAADGSLSTLTAGTSNVRFGVNAGNSIIAGGNYNTVVGDEAGTAITTGERNSAFGTFALATNISGTNNVANGFQSLYSNTGNYNTAVGSLSLQANTTATNNTAVGYQSLKLNTTGTNNTALGYNVLSSNTTGQYNIAIGGNDSTSLSTLANNTTGSSNVAIGMAALLNNSTASNNTAVGYQSLRANTTGANNVAVGINAGNSITTGATNTLIGKDSGRFITTGSNNTVLGPYHGNQGGLDIRTASNNIVLSDGDGTPRAYFLNSTSDWLFHEGAFGIGGTSDATIYRTGADGSGLHFSTNSVLPASNVGAVNNNVMALGGAGNRFTDLYLSGGVYLGGTGAANKLDDYEEGTWTPAVVAYLGTNPTVSGSSAGFYTKVGNLVTVSFTFDSLSVSGTTTGIMKISGLPFIPSPDAAGAYSGSQITLQRLDTSCIMVLDDGFGILSQSNGGTWAWEQVSIFDGGSAMRATVSYRTNA